MSRRLLVVAGREASDYTSVCSALATDGGYRCEPLAWGSTAPERLRGGGADALVVDVAPHAPETARAFEWLHDHPLQLPTFAVLPCGAPPPLLRLASAVTDDFVLSPIRGDELRHRLERVLVPPAPHLDAVRARLAQEIGLTQLVGEDSAFTAAVAHLPVFAESGMPVLITGATGTGKEMCARAIHHLGKRRNLPFVAVDCGALPEHLFENELFGHVRGAFTDAHRDQRGLVAMAAGGTLFLDEIDALSLAVQAKLLRLLQDYTYRPLGAQRFERADVNVIAATNRDLEACVKAKEFRPDLYFRLNVLRLHLPTLRERCSDIVPLACHFLAASCSGCWPRKSFSPAALRALTLHDWPGNVRELLNVVQRAAVLSGAGPIQPAHLALGGTSSATQETTASFRESKATALAGFERRYVEDLLQRHGGNVTRAARDAKKDRRAFGRLVKKYNIPH